MKKWGLIMSEKRRKADKSHPDYPEYLRKCKEIQAAMIEETDKIEPSGVKDGPLGDVYKKYALQINALQKEYAYLFTIEQ